MILVGQYDSPFVRRVAIALNHYGMPFERRLLSVFQDFDAVAGMARGIGRAKDRLDRVIFDHLLERRIGLLALTCLS